MRMAAIRDIGWSVVRLLPGSERLARWVYNRLPSYLHDTPTKRMALHFRDRSVVRFIQIGAFDGVAGDPVREIIVGSDRWRGVLVEPQPQAFERLQMNYRGYEDRLTLLNCAISSRAGRLVMFYIPPDVIARESLPPWAAEVASFDRSSIEKSFPGIRYDELQVETLTIEQALARAGFDAVECIVMDVEGHEHEILGTLDLERIGASFICMEYVHLSARDRAATLDHLHKSGFSTKLFGRDLVAWHSSK